jgi:hypothetical protein
MTVAITAATTSLLVFMTSPPMMIASFVVKWGEQIRPDRVPHPHRICVAVRDRTRYLPWMCASVFASLPVVTPMSGCAIAKFALPTSDITMAAMYMTFFIVISYCCLSALS